jgi:hypothetical protein
MDRREQSSAPSASSASSAPNETARERDALGRFAPGNQLALGAGGNAGAMRRLRQAAIACGTPEKARRLMESLYRRALDGDNQAALIVCGYWFGKPQELEPEQKRDAMETLRALWREVEVEVRALPEHEEPSC